MHGDRKEKKEQQISKEVKGDKRKEEQVGSIDVSKDRLCFICVGTPACWLLPYCDRAQDTELAQQCHCLAFHTTVCCNQKEK